MLTYQQKIESCVISFLLTQFSSSEGAAWTFFAIVVTACTEVYMGTWKLVRVFMNLLQKVQLLSQNSHTLVIFLCRLVFLIKKVFRPQLFLWIFFSCFKIILWPGHDITIPFRHNVVKKGHCRTPSCLSSALCILPPNLPILAINNFYFSTHKINCLTLFHAQVSEYSKRLVK